MEQTTAPRTVLAQTLLVATTVPASQATKMKGVVTFAMVMWYIEKCRVNLNLHQILTNV